MLIKKTSNDPVRLTVLPNHGYSSATMPHADALMLTPPRYHQRLAAVAYGPVGGSLAYDEYSGIAVGDRVAHGTRGAGKVIDFGGGQIEVAWDNGTTTTAPASSLRPLVTAG